MLIMNYIKVVEAKLMILQLFEYDRVVIILLNGVTDVNQEGFVQRIAIYLLNSLACQVDGTQKQFLGNNGAILVSYAFYLTYTAHNCAGCSVLRPSRCSKYLL